MKAGNAHLQPKPKNQVFAASPKPAALGVQQGPYPHPQHFYQIPFIIGQYLFILWGGGRYFSCTYTTVCKCPKNKLNTDLPVKSMEAKQKKYSLFGEPG